jgi:RimJ/RimL family protein N-acetyltransferase
MKVLIDQQFKEVIHDWFRERVDGSPMLSGEYTALGVYTRDRGIVGAALFCDYTGRNVFVHIALDSVAAARPLFRLIGQYAFTQLRCERLTLVAESTNVKAVKLHEKLGAIREGCLVGAGRSGENILISRLTPDCIIWRKLKDGKVKQTASGT